MRADRPILTTRRSPDATSWYAFDRLIASWAAASGMVMSMVSIEDSLGVSLPTSVGSLNHGVSRRWGRLLRIPQDVRDVAGRFSHPPTLRVHASPPPCGNTGSAESACPAPRGSGPR